MRTLVTILVVSSLVLAGCGRVRESKLNPGNWFGQSRVERVEARRAKTAKDAAEANPLIPAQRPSVFRKKSDEESYEGTPVHSIESLIVERSSGGAIVRATGLALRQGVYDVRLISETDGEPVDGVLTYELQALQPTRTPQGPRQTRMVDAAVFISTQTLETVKAIRVAGATNARSTKR